MACLVWERTHPRSSWIWIISPTVQNWWKADCSRGCWHPSSLCLLCLSILRSWIFFFVSGSFLCSWGNWIYQAPDENFPWSQILLYGFLSSFPLLSSLCPCFFPEINSFQAFTYIPALKWDIRASTVPPIFLILWVTTGSPFLSVLPC